MKIILIILLAITLLVSQSSYANQQYTCEQWSVLDIRFELNSDVNQPFEIHFGAILTHEGGKSINVPGFYNDNSSWIIRFCPDAEGNWYYKTYASLPILSGQEGLIKVVTNKKSGEHGPVVISKKDPQKFEYSDGTPYFLLAFELDWLFALDWDNEQNIPKTRQIISQISENKFNQIIMNVYAYDADWGERDKIKPEHNFARPKVFPFGGTNANPDYTRLNVDFFKHLDRVIAHLDEKEIIAHLMIYVWNKKVNWPEPDTEADNMYFDYVVKRYQAYPNLIWDISKEALAYGRNDMSYITGRIERLRKLDGHGRLLTVHDYNYCAAFPGKVDFISIQEWNPNIYNAMLNVYKTHRNKPVFNIEHGGYEKTTYSIFDGAYNDPLACLDRNYKCIFAGTYSTYYWQNSSWYNIIYDPSNLPPPEQPAFCYYHNLIELFDKYNFNELKPLQTPFFPYCLTDNSSVYLFYIPENMIALTGNLPDLKGKRVEVHWYDPLTGIYSEKELRKFDQGTWLDTRKSPQIKSPFSVVVFEVVKRHM